MRRSRFFDLFTAIVIVMAIFYSTLLCAQKLTQSAIYKQSRIVSMIVQQDSIGISNLLEDTRNVDMLVKFAGALTSAYINFELIPLNEPATFVAVFESLPEDVTVTEFEYRRKDLLITGLADHEDAYQNFLHTLELRNYFASVSGHRYDSTSGKIKFEITCASGIAETYVDLVKGILPVPDVQ